ncbi:alpha/beta hydrolase [Streptomyces carpaticus]|nr:MULTISPECIES: alpha/beta hydrolase [Streptomyces]MCK1815877.1 alpha/beta hydrolase [Streptomyces sp. XM4011]QKV70541.1 alpha/beta hydrolase [Streptomyces harbinensis]UWM50974.1 alpha/beta hydrolase [Streptomyces carpaticus]
MSRPPFTQMPPGTRAHRLRTRRGAFAALDAAPVGEPAGTVLLVPGYTGSKEDFIALLEPLAAAGYRAVAVDGRGQYETPGGHGWDSYRLGALAEDVLAQADALALEGTPLHLAGHSLGGLIARGAVLRAAEGGATPFASLTLIASGPGKVVSWQRWKTRFLTAGLPVLGTTGVWRVTHRTREALPDAAVPDASTGTEGVVSPLGVDGFLRRRWLATTPAQLIATGRTLRHEPDRVEHLAATGVPVHVVSGVRDGVWPIAQLDAMAARLRARRTVISGSEHSPNTERPAATAAELLDFWRALDRGDPAEAVSR